MMKNLNFILKKYISLTIIRRLTLIFIDATLIIFSFTFLSILTNINITELTVKSYIFTGISVFIGILLYILLGQYKSLTKYQSRNLLYKILFRNLIYIFFTYCLAKLMKIDLFNISFSINFLIFLSFTLYMVRMIMRDILFKLNLNKERINTKKNVAIFGAGEAGIQLANTLNLANTHNVKFFVDDNSKILNRYINGIQIISRDTLIKNINQIEQLLIAIPSLNKKQKKNIINFAQTLKIPVLKVPNLIDMYSGISKINKLQHIEIEDILGREPIKESNINLDTEFFNSTICVTGAGGSIGSELCLQVVKLKPKRLILIEQSEHSLYKINKKLLQIKDSSIEVNGFLGNCTDSKFIESIFEKESIKIILHAAAYKHVPIVENNPITGIYNNILSTKILCLAAKKYKAQKVMLISTDKAVRPSSIMGASKRLSELIMKYFASKEAINTNETLDLDNNTSFSMVRFGNVLGSSGSVVPLFNEQISNGGPITVTHPDIVRYFMTIQEASQLVLQATIICKGDDLFLLDMGSPVKIEELARQIVQLRGLSIKDKKNPNGDIEIKYTGLRTGEKLYEELLISGDSKPTKHPSIYKAVEGKVEFDYFWKQLIELENELKANHVESSLRILKNMVPEWRKSN